MPISFDKQLQVATMPFLPQII